MDDFFVREPEQSFSAKSKFKEKATTHKAKRISFVNIPFQNAAVVLMNHPASLTLYKNLSVTVLTGSVSLNGYEICKNKSAHIYSSEKIGLIAMKTETVESVWKKKSSLLKLQESLKNFIDSRELISKILEKLANSTVAVHIQDFLLPHNVEFAEFYFTHAFEFNLFKKKENKNNLWFHEDKKLPLHFHLEEEELACEIACSVSKAKFTECDNARILVCGPRNSGKSTLLQFLINQVLSQFNCAYYLDTDPGQPEFTPPGVVSLTEVKEPIFGAPFIHQKKSAKMMFTGDVSPSFIDLYCKNIFSLMNLYFEKYRNEALFVNTMGWMEGTGLQCLIETIAAVKPTILVEIVAEGETSMFDYREYLSPSSQYFQIRCKHEGKPVFSPKEMRELSLLSHLGMSLAPYLKVLPINEIKPHAVPWDKVALFIFPGANVLPFRIVEALNGSIVALCSVPETSILESNIPEFPRTLESESDNECFAYGLIQAVDEREHLLYIISPLTGKDWAKVNAIIKGNIMTPDALIEKQDIYHVPLPHGDREIIVTSDEEKMDISMLSLKYLTESETESPDAKLKVFPALENIRKPVEKRHRQKFLKKFMRN